MRYVVHAGGQRLLPVAEFHFRDSDIPAQPISYHGGSFYNAFSTFSAVLPQDDGYTLPTFRLFDEEGVMLRCRASISSIADGLVRCEGIVEMVFEPENIQDLRVAVKKALDTADPA